MSMNVLKEGMTVLKCVQIQMGVMSASVTMGIFWPMIVVDVMVYRIPKYKLQYHACSDNFADIDECSSGTHLCVHNCNNIIGSYTCSCDTGYRLNDDQRQCDGNNILNQIGNFYASITAFMLYF